MKIFERLFVFVAVQICLILFSSAKRIPKWHLKIAQRQGPNTCVVEEVPGTNKKYWTECKYWMNREICGSKTVLRYECCEGFHQLPRNGGCLSVKPLTDVVRTAKDLGATVLADYLREAGLEERLRQPGEAITLFAPVNEAFDKMSASDLESFRLSLLDRESPFLLYHAVRGRKLHSKDFKGDQVFETMNGGSTIRINKYNHGMTTVNCAPMVRKDQQATNGIVHLIDQVLIPPTGPSPSIAESLFSDGRFREMSRLLLQSDYVHALRREGPFTLLAPTDEAFQSMPAQQLRRITDDPEARLALIKNHILPHTVCLPAVMDTHKMRTVDGGPLQLSCNQSGVYVEDARILPHQMMAQNGVISTLSQVLVPDRARSVMSLLSRRPEQVSTFSRLLRSSGVEQYLDKPNITVTVFAPSNYAFNQMAEEDFSLLDEDQRKLEELLKHHIVVGRVKTESISDDQKVDSIDEQNALRLKVYRKEVGVESAILEESDVEGQNGVVHIIDRVLVPPSHSIMELLQSKEEYSVLADAIHHVQEFEPQFLSSRGGNTSFTLFAPNNEAFRKLDDLNALMRNRRKLKKMVQNHVVDNMFSTGSIHSRLQYDVRTEYQTVQVHKEKDGLMVNSAHVIMPDVVTKDGIVHCIDQVLVPKKRRKME